MVQVELLNYGYDDMIMKECFMVVIVVFGILDIEGDEFDWFCYCIFINGSKVELLLMLDIFEIVL